MSTQARPARARNIMHARASWHIRRPPACARRRLIVLLPRSLPRAGYTLLSAYLVFFMQAGFAMLSAGSVRAKNAKVGAGADAWAVTACCRLALECRLASCTLCCCRLRAHSDLPLCSPSFSIAEHHPPEPAGRLLRLHRLVRRGVRLAAVPGSGRCSTPSPRATAALGGAAPHGCSAAAWPAWRRWGSAPTTAALPPSCSPSPPLTPPASRYATGWAFAFGDPTQDAATGEYEWQGNPFIGHTYFFQARDGWAFAGMRAVLGSVWSGGKRWQRQPPPTRRAPSTPALNPRSQPRLHCLQAGLPRTSYALWFFQFTFAATSATIVSGAVAERCRFECYVAYNLALVSFVYPCVAHW